MPTVSAQKIPRSSNKSPTTEFLLAQFCYYFPAYKYSEARKLPAKRIIQMLKVVEREQAKKMYLLTEIATAPHTKKMNWVKKLFERFKSVIDGT